MLSPYRFILILNINACASQSMSSAHIINPRVSQSVISCSAIGIPSLVSTPSRNLKTEDGISILFYFTRTCLLYQAWLGVGIVDVLWLAYLEPLQEIQALAPPVKRPYISVRRIYGNTIYAFRLHCYARLSRTNSWIYPLAPYIQTTNAFFVDDPLQSPLCIPFHHSGQFIKER